MTYKEQKQLLTEEYDEKLRSLKESFLKHARYSKRQLVLYQTPVYSGIDSAYDSAYDSTYAFQIGIINNVVIDDSDRINYRVSSANVTSDGRICEGREYSFAYDDDILEVLDAEAIIFKYFRKA